jgi:DNA-binding LacI/PurR family transcriptional regulator
VDNIAEASHFWPPLTTVHQPLADAGVLAVKAIDQLIARSRQPKRSQDPLPEMTLLQPELIIRESSRRATSVHAPRAEDLVLPGTGAGRTLQLSETA